jgi:hypothetical protein
MSNWIQAAEPKKGALHRQLGVPEGEKIPVGILYRIRDARPGTETPVHGKKVSVTPLLKKRANFAINIRR